MSNPSTSSITPNGKAGNAAPPPDLPPHDAWLLARYLAGGVSVHSQPIDVGMFASELGRDAWQNVDGASDRDAALNAWLATLPKADADALKALIVAQDPSDDGEPTDEPPPPPRLVLHSIDEALDADEEVPWVIDGLFSRGSVSLVFGKPGAKKTWLCLDCGIHVAAGEDWLGRAVEQGPVLVIDEESGPRRLRRRFRWLLNGHGLGRGLPVHFVSLALLNLASNGQDAQAVDELLGQVKPALVVIDALIDVSGGADENAAGDMQRLMQTLRQLAEKHDCAIVLIHHAGKAGQYRGSSAIMGAVDLALEVSSETDSPNVDCRAEKARDVEPFTFAAAAKVDTLHESWDFISTGPKPKTERYSKSEDYVVRWLTDHKAQTIADLEAHVDACTPVAARRAVYGLVKRGIVYRSDAGGPGEKATYDLVPPKDEDRTQPVKNL